ncbi:competence protein ComGF [Streptococcus chenjunshii]|uniref:Competence protein ComGF n=1 Tax=Streptococcus chenjunshii TaxID=2173853 RepID=A0A372KL49_9STRE|nr:competence type IV pilus minor pilin ComGF [Streptococcus chenjunshii]AXQ77711.1 competence protein ComGF [Streptococcus chenjunshii]RFU50847.1 competence protein ComGF [Streptococcus chenjunshii]RFU52993.1 competence protein ComGF [Streptococcus chenjunshii]
MSMKMNKKFCVLKNFRVRSFTLLECIIALFVISGSVLVYEALTASLSTNIRYLSDNYQENWLLFSQQLHTELAGSQLEKVEGNKLYISRDGQQLALGQSKADDFRKTNADGRGYQPMLFGLADSHISRESNIVTIRLTFKNGLKRSFIYAFT